MTIRPKPILELFAVFIAVANCPSFAQIQGSSATSVAPLAASAPTVVPALVPYSGVAVNGDGHALSGETGITFLIYKDQSGGEPLFTETQSVVSDATGHYTVRLGASMSSGIPLDLFSSGEARWLEVQIAGEKPQPRVLLVSVPYALKAADAATLGGLPASAFVLAGAHVVTNPGLASAITPAAATTVTTNGGTANKLAKFTGASTIASSLIYDNGTEIGIGTTAPDATLNVHGTVELDGASTLNGPATLPSTGTATASTKFNSQQLKFYTSAYNSASKTVVVPRLEWQAEPTNNNTASPSGTLNLLSSTTIAASTETGFYFNANGTIHFAPGQTFPGGTGGGGTPICVATAGGFGSGGTTFIAPGFAVPAGGGCSPWSGFTKTASTVVLTTTGAGCLSSDGKKLTLSVSSADPNFFGSANPAWDYIQLTRTSTTGSFSSGSDQGQFSGSAKQTTCTSSLLHLNENND